MIRASTTGAMDFAKADLRDKYWWRKLNWVLNAIHEEDNYRLTEAQHIHWAAHFGNSRLDDEGRSVALSTAQEHLNKLIIFRYPEYEDELVNAMKANTREGAIEAYRERFGFPGDERYEKMLKDTMEAFGKLAAAKAAKRAAAASDT